MCTSLELLSFSVVGLPSPPATLPPPPPPPPPALHLPMPISLHACVRACVCVFSLVDALGRL